MGGRLRNPKGRERRAPSCWGTGRDRGSGLTLDHTKGEFGWRGPRKLFEFVALLDSGVARLIGRVDASMSRAAKSRLTTAQNALNSGARVA